MKIKITALILTLLLAAVFVSCSGAFIDPGQLAETGGSGSGGIGGGGIGGGGGNLCTVTFNINGGTGTAPASKRIRMGESITLPSGSGFSMSGYTLDYWSENKGGTGYYQYRSGSSYTVYEDVTFYAIWKLNPTISYEDNPIPLTEGIWENGNITTDSPNHEVWYSFDVTAGTTYYVWWNDDYSGDGTKKGDIYVTASFLGGSTIFSNAYSAWTAPRSFTASSTGIVKLKITPYSSRYGTFAITYTTTNDHPTTYTVTYNLNGGTGTTPAPHSTNAHKSITLPNSDGFARNGYEFHGWNTNAAGTGSNYTSTYTVTGNITLYAKWYNPSSEAVPIPLTAGTWENGIITTYTTNREVWYSFDVIAGTTYYVWWNDGYTGAGNGTKTLDVNVSAKYSNGAAIFTQIDAAWSVPRSFTANSNDTVKLRVYPYYSGSTGTFGIVYSTTSTRPQL